MQKAPGTPEANSHCTAAASASCNVLDWATLGNFTRAYEGVGFIISTENNVPGADEWWGSNPDVYGPGWMQDPELVAAVKQHRFNVPHCARLYLSAGTVSGKMLGSDKSDLGKDQGTGQKGDIPGGKDSGAWKSIVGSHLNSSSRPFR